MKFILGTAELCQPYGVGVSTAPTPDEAVLILKEAEKLGITFVDTALTYGCQEFLGKHLSPNISVITKVQRLDRASIAQCYVELQRTRLYGLLLHCGYNTPIPHKEMWLEAAKFPMKYLGASVYSDRQLGDVLDTIPVKIIQLPLNLKETWAARLLVALKRYRVEVHVRSVFGRGQLLKEGYSIKDCLKFVEDCGAENVIIGVNSVKELKEIIQ